MSGIIDWKCCMWTGEGIICKFIICRLPRETSGFPWVEPPILDLNQPKKVGRLVPCGLPEVASIIAGATFGGGWRNTHEISVQERMSIMWATHGSGSQWLLGSPLEKNNDKQRTWWGSPVSRWWNLLASLFTIHVPRSLITHFADDEFASDANGTTCGHCFWKKLEFIFTFGWWTTDIWNPVTSAIS